MPRGPTGDRLAHGPAPVALYSPHSTLSPETLEHAATGRDALLEPPRPWYNTQHAGHTASESPGNLPSLVTSYNSS